MSVLCCAVLSAVRRDLALLSVCVERVVCRARSIFHLALSLATRVGDSKTRQAVLANLSQLGQDDGAEEAEEGWLQTKLEQLMTERGREVTTLSY